MSVQAIEAPPASNGLIVGVVVFSGVIVALGAAGANSGLAVLAAATLLALMALLARTARLPGLLAAVALPWLQASAGVFHSSWLGVDIADYSPYGGDMRDAAALSLASVAAVALGLRLGAGSPGAEIDVDACRIAKSAPLVKWFSAYAAAAGVSLLLQPATSLAPGLYQFFFATYNLKWGFFFALVYAGAAKGKPVNAYFACAFAVELALGLGGFFSDFKAPFLFTLLGLAAAPRRVDGRGLILLGAATLSLLLMAAAWSEIKGQYRNFVSGGSNQQVIAIDYQSRMATLASMFAGLGYDELADGFDKLVRRISYVEYLAVELEYVPKAAPYTNGAITIDAVTRPFMPRIFFPEKSVIDDTKRTERLTGLDLGGGTGTSISLGYVGEIYSDFGLPWMFGVLVAIGAAYGWSFRWLTRSRRFAGPLGMGLACQAVLLVAALENSFTKVFGGYVASLLAAWVLGRFVVPRFWPWMLIASASPPSGGARRR